MKAETLFEGKRQTIEIEDDVELEVFRARGLATDDPPYPDAYRYLVSWSNVVPGQTRLKREDVHTAQIYLTDVELGDLAAKISKIRAMPGQDGKGGAMTKLTKAQKETLASWNVVVGALLNEIQYQRELVAAAYEVKSECRAAYIDAMHRAAKALAVFVGPSVAPLQERTQVSANMSEATNPMCAAIFEARVKQIIAEAAL